MNLATLTLLSLATVAGQAPPSSPAADYTVLRSRNLQVPIEYVAGKRNAIQQVTLVVSSNRGETWETVAVVTPDKSTFTYTVPEDGLYWVNSVIVYRDGTRDPANVALVPPAAKLLIDSTRPELRITGANRIGEDVVVDWSVEDRFPNDVATQVNYRPLDGTESGWVPVAPSSIQKRSTKFKPNTTGPIQVQVHVQDHAGNTTVTTRDVNGSTTTAFLSTNTPAPSIAPATNMEPPVMPAPTIPSSPGNVGAGLVAPMMTPTLPTAVPPTTVPPTAVPPPSIPPTLPSDPPAFTPPAPAALPTTTPPPVATSPAAPATGDWQPAAAPRPIAVGSGTSGTTPEAAAAGVQVVNFMRFDLQYQLENGPSGVHHVDLYVTRDDGRTWNKWSQHDGRETPIRVMLDTRQNQQPEGDYGFRLVPVSGAGLSDGPPAPGSAAEMRVHVDVTPPVIKVFAPTADPTQRNTLLLHWEATDRNFGRDPLAIEWSEQPSGPWKSVSSDAILPVAGPGAAGPRVANTGSLAWALPPNLATHKVYLRFTAWDNAGNKSEVVTPSPVMVDLTKPRAKIQGILGTPTMR